MEMRVINPPTQCPSCASTLELVNDQLFCRNSNCSAKCLKKLEHFAKTMKIKGLGEKTLEKLAEYDICDIPDIYTLSSELLFSIVGEKVGIKLLDEINKSKTIDLATFIAAFGIPLFGNTMANKLNSIEKDLEDITYEDLRAVGIGDKASSNFIDWVENEWIPNYSKLPIIIKKSSNGPKQSLGTVVITGTFDKSRKVLEEELRNHGFDVKESVSSKTKYLLKGEGKPSSKEKKAKDLNISIVYSIEELLNDILE